MRTHAPPLGMLVRRIYMVQDDGTTMYSKSCLSIFYAFSVAFMWKQLRAKWKRQQQRVFLRVLTLRTILSDLMSPKTLIVVLAEQYPVSRLKQKFVGFFEKFTQIKRLSFCCWYTILIAVFEICRDSALQSQPSFLNMPQPDVGSILAGLRTPKTKDTNTENDSFHVRRSLVNLIRTSAIKLD